MRRPGTRVFTVVIGSAAMWQVLSTVLLVQRSSRSKASHSSQKSLSTQHDTVSVSLTSKGYNNAILSHFYSCQLFMQTPIVFVSIDKARFSYIMSISKKIDCDIIDKV